MNLNSISILLVRPRYHENIGSVARAMKNMGLNRLVVVDGSSPLHRDAYKLASGAEDILERAEEFPSLREAISEMEVRGGDDVPGWKGEKSSADSKKRGREAYSHLRGKFHRPRLWV